MSIRIVLFSKENVLIGSQTLVVTELIVMAYSYTQRQVRVRIPPTPRGFPRHWSMVTVILCRKFTLHTKADRSLSLRTDLCQQMVVSGKGPCTRLRVCEWPISCKRHQVYWPLLFSLVTKLTHRRYSAWNLHCIIEFRTNGCQAIHLFSD